MSVLILMLSFTLPFIIGLLLRYAFSRPRTPFKNFVMTITIVFWISCVVFWWSELIAPASTSVPESWCWWGESRPWIQVERERAFAEGYGCGFESGNGIYGHRIEYPNTGRLCALSGWFRGEVMEARVLTQLHLIQHIPPSTAFLIEPEISYFLINNQHYHHYYFHWNPRRPNPYHQNVTNAFLFLSLVISFRPKNSHVYFFSKNHIKFCQNKYTVADLPNSIPGFTY